MNTPTSVIVVALAAAALLAMPRAASATGDPAAGQKKAATCEACHGKEGRSIDPNYPNLGGQHASYLIKALSDYRSGKRKEAVMASMAMNLSNQDIEDLAAWFSSLKGLEDLSIE